MREIDPGSPLGDLFVLDAVRSVLSKNGDGIIHDDESRLIITSQAGICHDRDGVFQGFSRIMARPDVKTKHGWSRFGSGGVRKITGRVGSGRARRFSGRAESS